MGRSAFISLMLAAFAAGWVSNALAAGDELRRRRGAVEAHHALRFFRAADALPLKAPLE